jgi:hypothetical protein
MHALLLELYNRLPPSNRVHALSASLLPSAKCHKSFSNFLLIVDFFLFLLLSGFFKFDSDFGLSCSCYLCNSFHMNCYHGLLMYFILSCVFPCLRRRSMFYPAWPSLRVPFLRQLMLCVFPSFSLTRDNDSCSDHIFDS